MQLAGALIFIYCALTIIGTFVSDVLLVAARSAHPAGVSEGHDARSTHSDAQAAGRKALRRPDLASQWQLMWWKFRRHKLAMVGLALLGMFLVFALFAEFDQPLSAGQRDPQVRRRRADDAALLRADGNFHLRPFVYGRKAERDTVTLRMKHDVDTSQHLGDSVLRARRALSAARR